MIGAVLLVAFLVWELRSRHPMLDMHFFENPRFSAASGAITLVFLSLFGTLFLLTQYLQSVLGYSTVKAGAVLLPQAAVLMIFAPLSNVWVQRFGNKMVVTTGLLIVTASLVPFSDVPARQQRAARHRGHRCCSASGWPTCSRPAPTRSWARCRARRPASGRR